MLAFSPSPPKKERERETPVDRKDCRASCSEDYETKAEVAECKRGCAADFVDCKQSCAAKK